MKWNFVSSPLTCLASSLPSSTIHLFHLIAGCTSHAHLPTSYPNQTRSDQCSLFHPGPSFPVSTCICTCTCTCTSTSTSISHMESLLSSISISGSSSNNLQQPPHHFPRVVARLSIPLPLHIQILHSYSLIFHPLVQALFQPINLHISF